MSYIISFVFLVLGCVLWVLVDVINAQHRQMERLQTLYTFYRSECTYYKTLTKYMGKK